MNQNQSPSLDLSLVLPCFNEATTLSLTVKRLIRSFTETNFSYELVLVDNGSTDNTGEIIQQLINDGLPVTKVTVEKNQGYGNGVLHGLGASRGKLVGFMVADGQVSEDDVVSLCEIAVHAHTPKIFKIHRRFRMDGFPRKLITTCYNFFIYLLYGNLGSFDINANPKILFRKDLERINLQSKDWFIDAELMIKAKKIGLKVFEMNAMAQMRLEGTSHVRPDTVWEFIRNLVYYRIYAKLYHQ
jgi:dolichol-phosphate mannosyltransferase